MKHENGYVASELVLVPFFVLIFAAWLTHVFYCIAVEKFILLIAGSLVFPVGVIHGIGIWFEVW